jgi:hypothetical protein
MNNAEAVRIVKDLAWQNGWDADEQNIQVILLQKVLVVTAPLSRDQRRLLNAAVKSGRLAHKKKDGHYPEVYYKNTPNGEWCADQRRVEHRDNTERALYAYAHAGWNKNV